MTASIVNQVGAYAVHPEDVPLFTSHGFTLAMTSNPYNPAYEGCTIIDTGPLKIIRSAILRLYPGHKNDSQPIPFTGRQRAKILSTVKDRVVAAAEVPNVAAFYVLDDYSGNAWNVYRDVFDVIQEFAPGRTMIQGMGCTLDVSKDGGESFEPIFSSRKRFSELELLNYVPGAAPLLYVYSLGRQVPHSDYSMSKLLPWMLEKLTAVGWDAAGDLLIGGPQCWEGVPPSLSQVREQTAAFARGGASAICAFTWHNFMDGQPELSNSPELRAGLQLGAQDAQAVWAQARKAA